MASNGAIEAKQTRAVPAVARGKQASTSSAVPTRSTVTTSRQSAMVGDTPAAWATARSVPSSFARAARRAMPSPSLTSSANASTFAGAPLDASCSAASASRRSSRSTRSTTSTMPATGRRTPHPFPAPPRSRCQPSWCSAAALGVPICGVPSSDVASAHPAGLRSRAGRHAGPGRTLGRSARVTAPRQKPTTRSSSARVGRTCCHKQSESNPSVACAASAASRTGASLPSATNGAWSREASGALAKWRPAASPPPTLLPFHSTASVVAAMSASACANTPSTQLRT